MRDAVTHRLSKLMTLVDDGEREFYFTENGDGRVTNAAPQWKLIINHLPPEMELRLWEKKPTEEVKIELCMGRIPVGQSMKVNRITITEKSCTWMTVNDGYHLGVPGEKVEVYI